MADGVIARLEAVIAALNAVRRELVIENPGDPPPLDSLLPADITTLGQEVLGNLQNQVLSCAPDLSNLRNVILLAGTLDAAKEWKFAQIDAKTDALIAEGFEFPPSSGKKFETSLEAQSRMNAMLVLATNPAMTYPIRWNTIDDNDYLDLPDAATTQMFCMTAVGFIRAMLSGGTDLKELVRAATTVQGVIDIEDPR